MTLSLPGTAGAAEDASISAMLSAAASSTAAAEPESPTVLRCTSAVDFLAALPFLTGFTATNSLFVVPFSGRRADGAVRLDLPPDDSAAAATPFLDALCELLIAAGLTRCRPAIVISSAQGFAESHGAPWRRLASRLRRRFAREGWELREFACIAPDGWISYLDPAAPARGRPLEQVRASPVRTTAREAQHRPPVPFAQFGGLPEVDPARRRAVAEALSALDGTIRQGGFDRRRALDVVDLVERCLAVRPEHLEAADAARLVSESDDATSWLLIALCTIVRPAFVRDLMEHDGTLIAQLGIGRFLRGISAEKPGLHRLRSAIETLACAAAHAPEAHRTAPLALLAWAWWMFGLQSVAAARLAEAAELDAGHELVLMVAQLIERPPEWLWAEAARASSSH